ncbi:hypothetical protein CAOG_010206 [Capsaspora owczarzaki ATCC 30864]|uniref:Uncharacterized protein n=1 Tax=Capsaspora owczarzaki (strain ATCC 30864) TaxID=595528 RepID=A0A0D2X5S6_CAPO3|nr:hypothetical protein CAOG_010206 [Capsaspora owczarzaki ATCC 30864]
MDRFRRNFTDYWDESTLDDDYDDEEYFKQVDEVMAGQANYEGQDESDEHSSDSDYSGSGAKLPKKAGGGGDILERQVQQLTYIDCNGTDKRSLSIEFQDEDGKALDMEDHETSAEMEASFVYVIFLSNMETG